MFLDLSVPGFQFSHRMATQSPLTCGSSLSCDSPWWRGHGSLAWAPGSRALCPLLHSLLRESLLPSHLMRQPSRCCLRNLEGDPVRTAFSRISWLWDSVLFVQLVFLNDKLQTFWFSPISTLGNRADLCSNFSSSISKLHELGYFYLWPLVYSFKAELLWRLNQNSRGQVLSTQ